MPPATAAAWSAAGSGLQWAANNAAVVSSKLSAARAAAPSTPAATMSSSTGLTGTGGHPAGRRQRSNLTGNNTYTGGTAVLAGTLAVNGSIAGNVAVGPAGTLGGNGTIAGNVVNAGTLAPGNSIGLLTVNGTYAQMAGSTYQVEVNAQGQGDRINVGGAAAIQGGTVQVLAAAGQLRQQHDLHDPARERRRGRHLRGRQQQLRLPDADAELRRQRRLPHPGAAGAERLHADLPGPDAQPEGGRRRAQPELRQCQRRLRHGDRRPGRSQHRAGPAGARYDQRPALCRLRHHEHQQRRDVHECAGPADGQRTRQQRQHRPAPGTGAGLRDRGLRWHGPVERVGQCAGRPGLGAGRRQCLHPHLQLRRRRGRPRLSLRSALPGRPRRRLHPRHAVGELLHGPGLVRQR